MLHIKNTSYILMLMGSFDCLTTAIGILYFGAVELNPFLTGIVSTNLPAFIILKITATICISLAFIHAEKTLMRDTYKTSKSFNFTYKLLKTATAGTIIFLTIVVANNVLVLMGII